MDGRRRVRGATRDDVAAIVALLRLHDPVPRARAELVVTRLMAGPAVALVVDDPLLDGLSAVLLAAPVDGGTWAVTAFEVRQRRDESTLLRTMLSHAADRLFRSGADVLVVPADPLRHERGRVLEAAGLEPASWVLWRSGARAVHVPSEPFSGGLPLPHLHGLRPHTPRVPVRTEGATAMVAPSTMPFGCRRSLEIMDVMDPLVATERAGLARLVADPAGPLVGRGAELAVVLGAGEEPLSDELRALGLRPLIDFWALHLTR